MGERNVVICNGCPKSGTHQLLRVCALLGLEFNPVSLYRPRPFSRTVGRRSKDDRRSPGPVLSIGGNHQYCHAHLAYRFRPLRGDHRLIVIQRDPRNVAVSAIRHRARNTAVRQARLTGRKMSAAEMRAAYTLDPEAGRAELIRLFARGHKGARNFVNFTRGFLGWERAGALVVRYETVDRPETVKAIADFIAIGCEPEVIAAHVRGDAAPVPDPFQRPLAQLSLAQRHLATWTGAPSRWQEWWDGEVDAAWRSIGGPELLAEMGYANPARHFQPVRWLAGVI